MSTREKDYLGKVPVDLQQVKKGVHVLYQYVQKSEKKDLLASPATETIRLQFGFKKIPRVQNKIIKIPLPTPLLMQTSDVCLFVKDLDKTQRDYEPTVRHYEELFKSKGITSISKIIPLKSVKLEYQPFEAKRNLSNMFDAYLADERIVRLLPGFLGKNFYGKKKHPIQLNLKATDLSKEVANALSLARCVISGRGSSSQVTVAHVGMSEEQATQNVQAAILRVAEKIPGGAVNIKSMHLTVSDCPFLPIYLSQGGPEDVTLPSQPTAAITDEPEDVTTVMHGKVHVTPKGRIRIINRATEKFFTKDGKRKVKRGSKRGKEKRTNSAAKPRGKPQDKKTVSGKGHERPDQVNVKCQVEGQGEAVAEVKEETSNHSPPTSGQRRKRTSRKQEKLPAAKLSKINPKQTDVKTEDEPAIKTVKTDKKTMVTQSTLVANARRKLAKKK